MNGIAARKMCMAESLSRLGSGKTQGEYGYLFASRGYIDCASELVDVKRTPEAVAEVRQAGRACG